MDNSTRMKLERIAVTLVLQKMRDEGWREIAFNDGGDTNVVVPGDTLILEEVTAADECRIYYAKDDESGWVYLVYGNDPDEVVCDYTINMPLDDFVGGLPDLIQNKLCEMSGI